MIDHVTIRVSDLEASRSFYRRVFELLDFPGSPTETDDFSEWNDFSISRGGGEKPVTQRLHVGFVATSREQVDEWWRAMTAAGYPDDGQPGRRPEYGPEYYGAFVLDPDGNSTEAMINGPAKTGGAVVDHLWIRVRDLDASTRFYESLAPVIGFEVRPLPNRAQIRLGRSSFSVVDDGVPTKNVHLAFGAPDRATVDAFHRAGVDAGYVSNGEPGERPQYHHGYYGAFLLDPDGNNIEAVFHDGG